ncbi:MAG: hypothetical protein ABI988_20750, partial [Nitrospirota bacterium]
KDGGVYSLISSRSNFDMLMEFADDPKAVPAIGTRAAAGVLAVIWGALFEQFANLGVAARMRSHIEIPLGRRSAS